MMAATHSGMTTESSAARQRLDRDREPSEDGPAVHAMVYQPMLELLAYLRANGFKTYIVSGGGVEFMRPWTERCTEFRPNR